MRRLFGPTAQHGARPSAAGRPSKRPKAESPAALCALSQKRHASHVTPCKNWSLQRHAPWARARDEAACRRLTAVTLANANVHRWP
jgi:hypothetical protein